MKIFKIIVYSSIFILFSCTSKETFKLCPGDIFPYYYPELSYEGDFWKIKSHFYNGFKKVDCTRNSGIIRIQFIINCHGEMGKFNVATYSLAYINNSIDNRIVDQLFKLTKGLKEWKPAIDKKGNPINSHKFFAFKVVSGELVDILPK